ncbi:MAG: hypothetical protein ACE5IL_00225 [Myxococcota bacterium]
MSQLVYSREELLRSHDYATEHRAAGRRLHGGFDAEGRYVPPRSLVRGPAIAAWTRALRARGGDLLEADSSLLAGVRYPSEEQIKLLLREGLGQIFWDSLTITGLIEARGRFLAEMEFPEIADAVVEDVSEQAVGHLNRGLLHAHGIDEGGEPEKGIGGHDVMWFVLRDLAFGPRDWPTPEVPENIGRPDAADRLVPEIPVAYERFIYFLLNLLMIEFRAERGFSSTESILRDPSLFRDRRSEAEKAAEMVGRIRTDEEIHVLSLRLYLGELRGLTFRTADGDLLPGDRVVDPLWNTIVTWATVEQPKRMAEQQRKNLTERILAHPGGERILEQFNTLEDPSS